MIANLIWVLDFELRKLNRRPHLFTGNRTNSPQIEKEYDQILDVLKESLEKNYGENEIYSALDIVELKRGYETEYEKHMRGLAEREEKAIDKIDEQKKFSAAKNRSQMSLD